MAKNKLDEFHMNELVFVPDKEEGFVPGEIASEFKRGEEGKVRFTHRNGFLRTVSKAETKLIERMDPQSYQDVPDLIRLKLLNNASLLYNLRLRYCNDEQSVIYTNIGSILIAINPFTDLGLYTQPYEDLYLDAGSKLGDLPPHIFKVAESAFINMNVENKDQSCVITGESGAGKTETTKRFLQYISEKSKRNKEASGAEFGLDTEALRQQILDSNPFMEAFGNAKTLRNDNSSRFGKLIEMFFDIKSGVVVGARITNYLLEKSRVVKVSAGESSYHIFYQLCAASTVDDKLRRKFHLETSISFNYTLGDNEKLGDLEVEEEGNAFVLQETKQAMKKLGMNDEEIDTTFRICAGILHVGNIEFVGSAKDLAELQDGVQEGPVAYAAELLQVNDEDLEKAILERSLRGTDVKRHTVQEAEAARDALSKFVYEKLFDWLIGKMNTAMATKNTGDMTGQLRVLSVLDIFGFETFAINSFEQMCINYCNEKLQGFFNFHIFKKEQLEYRQEGIDFRNIGFSDNQGVIDTFEKGNDAIMTMCDDACNLESSKDSDLLRRILGNASKQSAKDAHTKFLFVPKIQDIRRQKNLATAFCVKHYAGLIHYNIENFLEKNKDQLRRDIRLCLASSSCDLIASFFPDGGDPSEGKQQTYKNTLSMKFRNSLNRLMRRLNGTTPQFVRCIKPNEKRTPGEFDHVKIMKQLNEAGLLEVCRIRKLGYPIRKTHKEFMDDYLCLDRSARSLEDLEASLIKRGILYQTNNTPNWQIGKTVVFLRADQLYTLNRERGEALKETLRIIQGFTRKFLFRIKVKKALKALKRIEYGIAKRQPEILQQGLDFFLAKGAMFGKLPVVINGLMVMKDLQVEIDLIKDLRDAIDNQDCNTIKVKLELAAKMKFEHELLEKGQAVLEDYELSRAVNKRLKEAMSRRDIDMLEAAVKYAEEQQKTDSNQYEQASRMLSNMKEKSTKMDALRKQLQNDEVDKAVLEGLIEELKSIGVEVDHPLLIEAARRGDLIIEREKKREKLVLGLENQLKRYIKKGDVQKLKELVELAVNCKYDSELVSEARELITHLEQRNELLEEVSHSYRVLTEKMKLSEGITENDIKPLLHAIKTASSVPTLNLEREIQVVESLKLADRARDQINAQEEVSAVLQSSSEKNQYKMLEKIQKLGLQTKEANQLVQKIKQKEVLVSRAEILINKQTVKENLRKLRVPGEVERSRHLIKRIKRMNGNDFVQLCEEVMQSTEFLFVNFFRLRGMADYLSRERRKQKPARRQFRFAYEKDRPISRSILELDDYQEVVAIQINKMIHKFCSHLGNKENYFEKSVSFIVEQGIVDSMVGDEIYMQLAKHIRGNPVGSSKRFAWHLFCLCATYFAPTRQFLPYILFFLQTYLDLPGQLANYGKYILSQLSASLLFDPVKVGYKPGAEESRGYFAESLPLILEIETLAGTIKSAPLPPDYTLKAAIPLINNATKMNVSKDNPDWAVFVYRRVLPVKRTYRERLELFYRRYKPANLGCIDEILAQYKGREAQLFQTLVQMDGYGPEPVITPRKDRKRGASSQSAGSTSGSVFSRFSLSATAKTIKKGVKKVVRRIRGKKKKVYPKFLRPLPKAPWPIPWSVTAGRIANTLYSRGKMPEFGYRRRFMPKSIEFESNIFVQLKFEFRQGYLFRGNDRKLADLAALLLCEENARKGREMHYGDKNKIEIGNIYRNLPSKLAGSKDLTDEWWDNFMEVVAHRTLEYKDMDVYELQYRFFEDCKKMEAFGKMIFFGQILESRTSTIMSKGETPLEEGMVTIGIGPTEVSFYNYRTNKRITTFHLNDLARARIEGQVTLWTIRSDLKTPEEEDPERAPRTTSQILTKGLSAKMAIASMFNSKSYITFFSKQRSEIMSLLKYFVTMHPDDRE